MCEICRSVPCNPRCPNAADPKTRGVCVNCHEGLREDDTYFSDADGNTFCSKDCAIEFNQIKEKEWNYD